MNPIQAHPASLACCFPLSAREYSGFMPCSCASRQAQHSQTCHRNMLAHMHRTTKAYPLADNNSCFICFTRAVPKQPTHTVLGSSCSVTHQRFRACDLKSVGCIREHSELAYQYSLRSGGHCCLHEALTASRRACPADWHATPSEHDTDGLHSCGTNKLCLFVDSIDDCMQVWARRIAPE